MLVGTIRRLTEFSQHLLSSAVIDKMRSLLRLMGEGGMAGRPEWAAHGVNTWLSVTGTVSCYAAWTAAPALSPALPFSPCWDSWRTSRTCPSRLWPSQVGVDLHASDIRPSCFLSPTLTDHQEQTARNIGDGGTLPPKYWQIPPPPPSQKKNMNMIDELQYGWVLRS